MRDITPEAEAVQEEPFRRMSPEERLQLASELSEFMRELALAGLRSRHPELSERQLIRELVRLWYGIELPPHFDGIV